MFKLKYNLLVIIQIFLGIINYVLLLRVFGVSIQSDAYLLAISSMTILFSLISMPINQFIPYYNDLKMKSLKQSHDFYNSIIFFAFVFGISFCMILNLFLPYITKLFAFGIDIERFYLFKTMLQILSFGLIFYPINQINNQLLNAEMRFSIPYILSCIPLAMITLTQIVMIKINSLNIINLIIAQSVGLIGISIFGTIYISKTLIKFKFVKWHKLLKNEIKNSLVIKFADFGWAIAIPILFNNILATFPKGYISYFYYARKILDIVNAFTVGPSAKILRSKISKHIAQKDSITIKIISKNFLIYGAVAFSLILILAYFLQTPILKIVTCGKLTPMDLKMISILFLTLVPWYLIMFIETPLVGIADMGKRAKEVLVINTIFLVSFTPLLFLLKPFLGIYSLGLSAFLAQIINLILFIYVSHDTLSRLQKRRNYESKYAF